MFLRLRLKKQLTVGLGAYILHLEEPPLGRSNAFTGIPQKK